MDKPYNENISSAKAVRESVAQEIIQFASRLSEMSEGLVARVQGKLQPVMLSDRPCGTVEKAREPREYPPLFEELRNRLQIIENSLRNIEGAISRTEL